MSIKVDKIDHISRASKDWRALMNWYIKVFGFKQIDRPPLPFDGAWLNMGNINMHIIERNPNDNIPEDPLNNNGKPFSDPVRLSQNCHFALNVSNFDAAIKKLNTFGVKYASFPIKNAPRNAFLYDPDGYGIEIREVKPKL